VAYVRHGVNTQWKSWDSVEQIAIWWFIHTIALFLFMAITSAAILRSHEFFIGHKPEQNADENVPFYVLMTVLIAAVSIYLLSHWIPSGDYDDY
jgi:predicted secreted protein